MQPKPPHRTHSSRMGHGRGRRRGGNEVAIAAISSSSRCSSGTSSSRTGPGSPWRGVLPKQAGQAGSGCARFVGGSRPGGHLGRARRGRHGERKTEKGKGHEE